MTKRLLSYDEFTGFSTFHEHDPLTGKTTLTSIQDVEPLLEQNKLAQTDGTGGWASEQKGWRRAASIPLGVLEMWRVVDGIDWRDKNHAKAIMRKLDDPEFRHLRTATFRIGDHKAQ